MDFVKSSRNGEGLFLQVATGQRVLVFDLKALGASARFKESVKKLFGPGRQIYSTAGVKASIEQGGGWLADGLRSGGEFLERKLRGFYV